MTEEEWLACSKRSHPEQMLLYMFQRSTDRKIRLASVACSRCVWDQLQQADEQVCRSIEVGEAYADHQVSELERATAQAIVDREYAKLAYANHLQKFAWNVAWYVLATPNEYTTPDEYDPQEIIRYVKLVLIMEFTVPSNGGWSFASNQATRDADVAQQTQAERECDILRDIFGNPFRPITFSPSWRTDTVLSLSSKMYESREFSAMPILADALQDAGCDNDDVLNHCRGPGPHVRGCWVVDLILGKE